MKENWESVQADTRPGDTGNSDSCNALGHGATEPIRVPVRAALALVPLRSPASAFHHPRVYFIFARITLKLRARSLHKCGGVYW